MLGGSVDLYDEVVSWYVAESGVPFLSVELRLAPEATSPTSLAEDVFSGLTGLADHATGLGVDPSRIAVMGDSGGGGPTAGAAILVRDRDVPVARQILVYPMLDDRNTTPGSLTPEFVTWSYDNNYTGWVTLLGDALGGDDVSPVASPARLANFAGLAPAYIEVGDLDIFRDEHRLRPRASQGGRAHRTPCPPRCSARLRALRPRRRPGSTSHGRPSPRRRHHLEVR
jgi:acetyl esterase/lipase